VTAEAATPMGSVRNGQLANPLEVNMTPLRQVRWIPSADGIFAVIVSVTARAEYRSAPVPPKEQQAYQPFNQGSSALRCFIQRATAIHGLCLRDDPFGRSRPRTAIAAMLPIVLAGLVVFIESEPALTSAASFNQSAVPVHSRLNRAPPQGIATCAGRSCGCN
jgi:hypothetical protein